MGFGAVSEAFARARRLDGEDRAVFLAGLDSEIRREVEDLLGHHESEAAPDFEPSWGSLAAMAAGTAEPPELSGFRIVRRVGAGGMGTVYEAEQLQPRRRVAIKLLSLLTSEGRRRFEREAQVLAELAHPGIAAIHAQGVTEAPAGELPYLVMEYVDGVPLTEYARGLDERARLELLVKVCDAVAHAHEHGVIHRDLKPGNILVAADGEPKVLDFGLARMAGVDSLQTRTGHVLGTLTYMSPEQAVGTPQAADTRSDVYALGVIAYELIRGEPPFDLAGLALPAAARKLADERAPSLPGGGDLAHIVAKALSKEKARRYATAGALGDDLRRYLADESVVARAPSAGDQIGRFVRRHKTLVLGVGATVLALAVGLVLALRFARDARVEERRARRLAAVASLHAAAAAEREGHVGNLSYHLDAVPPGERGWEWRYLDARRDRSLKVVPVGDVVYRASLGRDRLLFRGTRDPNPRLLNLDDGTSRPAVSSPRGALRTAFTMHDGRASLIYVRDGQYVRVDGPTAAPHPLGPWSPSRNVSACGFSADGSLFGWIELIGTHPARLHIDGAGSFGGGPMSFAFDAAGERVATGHGGGAVRVYRLSDRTLLRTLRAHHQAVVDVAFDRGDVLASASLDQTVVVWDVESGRILHRLRGHTGGAQAIAFTPDGRHLATGDGAGTVRIWDVTTGRRERVLGGHAREVKDLRFRDAERLVSVSLDDVRHWSIAMPEILHPPREPQGSAESAYVYGVAFSADGTRLASAAWDGTVRVYDASTRRGLRVLRGAGKFYSVAFSPDGREIAGGAHAVHVYDAETGEPRRTLDVLSQQQQIQRLRYTRDGRLVLAATSAETVLADARTGEVRNRWGNGGAYQRAALAPDDRTLAHARGPVVYLHAIAEGGIDGELHGHERDVFDLRFSPDGRSLATAGADQTVRVWDLPRREERLCLRGHTASVYAVAFAPDGTRLFSGSDDTTVRVWDLRHGEERLQLRGHGWYVFDLAVHPDGHTVASASGDATVRLWSTLSARELVAAAEAGGG